MAETSIEWTDRVWNPVRGCARVSEGCRNCYAERQAARFAGPGQPYEGLVERGTKGPRWTGEVRLVPEKLGEPLRWRKLTRVFVNSMSDLFHEGVPFEYVAAVFGVMAATPHHTFQVLTKRPERAREFFAWVDGGDLAHENRATMGCALAASKVLRERVVCDGWRSCARGDVPWPLPNVWLGVSVEDQATADERIPILLECPAAVRWVSAEPLLGPVDLRYLQPKDPPTEIDALAGTHGVLRPHGGTCAGLDWVVVGGESGPGARPCDVAWIRSIVEQCRAARVPAFVKQLGARPVIQHPVGAPGELVEARTADRKGGDPSEWPADLCVREMPEVRRG